MAEITVDVGVRLKAMQSSVADLQKVLDGLQPNSSGFKALQKIIADINRDIDRLRIQTSKPFGSQNQFNQTEKTVDKLEESLEKVKITIDRIKFSDLKLDSSQTAQLDNFKQQLKDIKQEFTDFKADLKGQFLDNDFNKAFVEGINPNLLNKSFDEIVKNVENRVNSLGSALAKAKADLEEFQNAAKIGEKVNKASQATNGVVSPDFMGQEMFDKFFQINSKGVFSFKTGGGLKKGEIQQQFLDYLTSEFQLTQTQIDQLKNQTAGNIRKILAQDDFFNSQKGAAETANKKMSGAESTFTSASKNYENAAAVITRLTPLLSALTNEETSLEDKQKLVNQAIRQFEQDCVNGAKSSKTLQDSTKGLSSGLESFKQQLGQVNAQWLNLQKQQATFNSMKTAIVNFMGFNQVLNITKRAVKEAMDHIKQLDTVMNGIAIVTDMTTADLWNQVDVYSEMAQRYGTSIQGAYEVSKIYYQAGYETNEVLTLMNETLKMSKISGLDYATTTDYMMNAIKGFKMEVADAAAVVDVYSALAANTAVSQQELAEAMSKTASSMAGVGSTFEDTSAMIATMVSVTRESANNIGSAMKSIASRYGELTKDPTKLLDSEGEAMSFNKVDTALKSVGITLQTTDHQFRDFTDVIVELADKWDTLDSAQQRYIATQFAGNRQQNRFLALVSNKDLLQENMDVAAASEDTGTLQALKALDSLESKLNQVQVAYQQFYTTIGAEGVWKTVLDGIKNFVDSLNGLPKVFDKIPLGAVAVLGNLIGLVKTALLNGLTTIAQEWNNIMNNTNNNAADMAQNGGDKIGKTWIGALFSAIKEGQPKIEAAMTEAVGSGNQKAQQEAKYTGTKINTEDFLFKDYYSKNFNPADTEKAADTYLQTLVNMEQAGTKFSQSTLNQLLDIGAAIENDGISLREAGQRAIQVIQDTGSAAETNTSKVSSFWQELGKSGSNWQKGLTGLSQSLTTIGMLLDKTSESGRIMSGVMTGLGGVVQTGVAAARVMAQDWSALPQLIMGIFNVINGIGIGWETDAERLERLTKEAENLTNESKKAKAEYNTLQRTVTKLEELKEKRYDSTEAAEEYQNAIDSLIDKYPQLITSLDATGNAAVEAASLDYELEKARRASAQATMEAVQAEIDAKKEEINQAKETNKKQRDNIFYLPSLTRGGSVEGLFTDSDIKNLFNSPMKAKNINAESMIGFITAKLDDIYNGNVEEISDNSTGISSTKYEDAGFTSYFGNDNVWHFKIDNDENFKTFLQNNNLEQYQEQILALADIDNKVKTSIEEQYAGLKTIDLKNLDENQESEFNDKVDGLIKTISSDTGAMVQYQPLLDVLTAYQKGSLTLAELNQQMTSLDKQLISSKVMSKFPEFYNNLGEFQNVIVNYLNSFEDEANFNKELENIKNQFELLSSSNRDKLLEMWKNKEQYTVQDFKDVVGENTSLFDSINNYYEQVLPDYTKFLQDKITEQFGNEPQIDNISDLGKAIEGAKGIISADLQGWISEVIDLISDYSKQGMIGHAEDVAANATEVLNALNNIKDPFTRAIITNSMKENGVSNISSIDSIISDITNIPELDSVRISLENLKSSLVHNLPLAIEAYTDQILTDIDNLEKEIKNISNGMSFSEAYAALEKINTANDTSFTLSDLDTKNGKLYFNNDRNNLQTLYLETITGNLQNTYDEISGQITNIGKKENDVNKQLKNLLNLDNFDPMENIFDKNKYEDLYKLLKDLNYVEDVKDKEGNWTQFKFTEEGILNLIESGKDPAQVIIDLLTERLGSAASAIEYANKILPAQTALETGDYQTYLQKITGLNFNVSDNDLAYIAKNGEYKDLDYKTEIKPLKDKINSVYNNLISDALSKGLDNIRPEDYEGLIDDNFDAGEEGPHRYEDFVRRYADLAGKSVEEINSLITQAIEKDTQTTTGAAAEAVGKIQWLSDKKGFASLGDIQSLADALGISVDAILGGYNAQLDMYLVDLSNVEGVDLSAIDGFSDIVKDSINAFLKQIFENVNKAITGKLTNADVTTLTGQLEQLGLKDITLDFTQTVDGLKLSQRSAIELYNELKKIDALQAQLVFDELAKSLEASDTNYTNISTTLARIAELEKAIQGMKPDDARLQMYKNELAVAQEIARTRSSTDNKDFNFMDRALPNGMQNPIDYWNATGEAYKVMNASAKSGYMEIQDFYNIVQEMSNMAQSSGQTLHFMGQEIDGSAEAAASLIQRGFSALTNVKGDGVKIALGNIGADFKTGAADMKGDFDSGIKEMAKSQIQMLDAVINMLEAIVAMEDIDIDQDGLLELGEIFNPDNTFTDKVDNWFTELDALTGGIEIGGVDLKTALFNMASEGEEGRQKVVDLLNQLYNIDWTLGDVNVFAQIQGILQAFYPGENITQGKSIFEMLEIPKNADKETEEFTTWVEKTGLAAKQAEQLINYLETGKDITYKNGERKTGYVEAIERLLELEKESQKQVLEDFAGKDNKLTQEEITLFSELDINWDEDGNVTDATYTASDGSKLSLNKDNPSTWQDDIAEYERKITIGQHTGQTTDEITDNSKLESIVLKSGLTVQGVISATSGGYTASYNGVTSPTFKSEDEARQWLYDLVNEKDKEKRSGGAYNPELVTDEVTGETKIKYNYRYILEPGTNKEDLVEPAKGVKQLDFKKDILPKIFKTGEKGEDGNFTYSLDDIGLTGMKITSKPGEIEQVLNDSLNDIIGETDPFAGLPEKIAEGITTAFTQDTSIGEAIGQGIRTALTTGTDENGQPEEIPLPTLTLKPESVTIQLGETEPTVQGLEGEGIKITSADITATNAYVSSANYQAGTAESPLTTVSLETIDSATGTVTTLYVKCPDGSVVGNKVTLTGFTANGTATTFTVDNTTGQLSTDEALNVPIFNAEGFITGFFWVDPSGAFYKGLKPGTKIEDLKGINQVTGEAVSITVECGEETSVSVNDPNVTISDEIKATAEKGKVTLTKYTISTVDGSGNIKTLVAYGEADLEAKISKYGVGFENNTPNTSGTINLTANEVGIVINTDNATLAWDNWLANKDGSEIEIKTKITPVDVDDSLNQTRTKIATARISQPEKGWGGKKAAKEAMGGKVVIEEYVSQMNQLVQAGESLSKVDLDNLEYIKSIFSGGLAGSIEGIDSILALSQVNENNGLEQLSTLAQSFSGLEVGELPEIATALQDIVTQAEILQGINWDKIVKGITNITNAQTGGGPTPTPTPTPAPSSGSDNSGNGGKVDLLDTSSLGVAVGEINSTISTISEAFSKSKDEINNIASAINEIKTDKINDIKTAQEAIGNDKVVAIQTAQENIGTGKIEAVKNAINSLGGTISLGVNVGVSVTGEGNAKGNIKSVSVSQGSVTRTENSAHWTQKKAYATGNTLMGELGPELVVSHGRYFVVGQNGPEMVNLADDAIVFNHLQTQQLLKRGKASGHATPVTNERNATSLATGNAGPAMASGASAALSALKQLRSMWQSLLNASLKDLGAMGGGSGGGGGGGGGQTPKELESVVRQYERWYNYIKEIEESQYNINKLTKEYTLLEKGGANSDKRLENLRARYDELQSEYNLRQDYIKEQEKYREKEIKRANEGLMGAFYNADPKTGRVYLINDDENNANFANYLKNVGAKGKLAKVMRNNGKIKKGQTLTYKSTITQSEADSNAEKEYKKWLKNNKNASQKDKDNKKKEYQEKWNKKVGKTQDKKLTFSREVRTGADFLAELQAKNKAGNNIHNYKEQYAMIEAMGLIDKVPQLLAGVDKTQEGWEQQVVENLYDAADADKEALESLTNSINEQKEASLDDAIAMREINEQIRELAKPVTGITDGLEEWYNELQRIEKTERNINKLAKKRSLLENDHIANGHEIYQNITEQRKQRESELKEYKELIAAQKTERDNLLTNKINQDARKALGINYDEKTGVATFGKLGNIQKSSVSLDYEDVDRFNGYELDTQGNYIDKNGQLRNKDKGDQIIEGSFGELKTKIVETNESYSLEGKTIDELIKDITKQNADGSVAMNAQQQYNTLVAGGLEKFMQYDEQGNKLYQDFGALDKETQAKMVEAGIKRIQSTIDELNESGKTIDENEEKALDIENELLETENELRQKSIDLENAVKDAIVQEHQDVIDEKKELTDAMKDAADKAISGLKDSLDKEKQTYDADTDNKELEVMQAQLATLRLSNGSQSKIQDLAKQIQDKQKDIYFKERELAIDELEDAANKQIDALNAQTDLMQSVLDHQVKYGLIWEKVQDKMSGVNAKELASYITNNSEGFLADNPQKQKDQITQAIENAQIYNDNRRDTNLKESIADLAKENSELNNSGVQEALLKIGQDAYNSYDTKTITNDKGEEKTVRTTHQERLEHANKAMSEAAGNAVWVNDNKKPQEPKVNPSEGQPVASDEPQQNPDGTLNGSNEPDEVPANITNFNKGTPYYNINKPQDSYGIRDKVSSFKHDKKVTVLGISSTPIYAYGETTSYDKNGKAIIGPPRKSYMVKVQTEAGNTWLVPLRKKHLAGGEAERERLKKIGLPKFENGGEIDFTGLAWVDGSKNKPEHIFNAEQMDFLKQGLTNNVNLTSSLVSSLNAALDGLIKNDTYSTINNDNESIIIEHAEVNVNVDEISSDYDARRLGQEAMAEMVRIARKSGNRYVSRR